MTELRSTNRILFYNHTGSISGAEVVLLSILRGLDRDRFEPVLLCPAGDLANAALELGVTHLEAASIQARFTKNPLQLLGYCMQLVNGMRRLRLLSKHRKPDLLHANSIRAGIVASVASIGLGFPVVWHLHDILPDHPLSSPIRKLANTLKRTELLAVSKATAHQFAFVANKKVLSKPVEIVYNSVDIHRFRPDAVMRSTVRAELGLNDDDIAIGMVAQITPRKRQVEFVRAFADAQSEMFHAKLVIVGAALFNSKNEEYGKLLRRTIIELGLEHKVMLTGKRSDVPAVLNAIDILAQSAEREPLGMTLLEAMATEKPVVAVSVDGTPEVIDDGINGYLTPADSRTAQMHRLQALVADSSLRSRLGRAGPAKVLARFSPEEQMQRMHAYYAKLIQG